MSNPRIKRLQRDYQKLRELEAQSKYVRIETYDGDPPDRYIIRLLCKGITDIDSSGRPRYSNLHRLGVVLHHEYPRRGPQFQMLTPVFHPNIGASGWVCIGDEGDHGYSPAMGLDDLVVRIIEIVRYENYSGSAANGLAREWVNRQNRNMFPLESDQIRGADIISQIDFIEEDDLGIEFF